MTFSVSSFFDNLTLSLNFSLTKSRTYLTSQTNIYLGLDDFKLNTPWRRGVVVITTAQLHSTKPELRFCTASNPARGVLEVCNGEDL